MALRRGDVFAVQNNRQMADSGHTCTVVELF